MDRVSGTLPTARVQRNRHCGHSSSPRPAGDNDIACPPTTFARTTGSIASSHTVSLESLLRESDIATSHLRFDSSTRGLIDARAIALVKQPAFLINVARGRIVDETALTSLRWTTRQNRSIFWPDWHRQDIDILS